jgi:sortase (surface protein transpeptidase)
VLLVSKNKTKIFFLVSAILILIIASFKVSNLKSKEDSLKSINKDYEQSQENSEAYEDTKENLSIENSNNEDTGENKNENIIWQIEIPAISLKADIREGTSSETLNKYDGHFEGTGVDVRKCRTSRT